VLEKPIRQSVSIPGIRADQLLFLVRWLLILAVVPVAWIDLDQIAFPPLILAWLAMASLLNLLIGVVLQLPHFFIRIRGVFIVTDVFLFGILPYLAPTPTNLLAYFSVFPALVAAVRFGSRVAIFIALILAVSLGAHFFFPFDQPVVRSAAATALPILAVVATAAFVGFLTEHEKADATTQAVQEISALRGAVAGAKLLYQTTSLLKLTTNYKTVLESMLEAGVRGLPEARHEDGPPVGIVFLFDEQDPQRRLAIYASRNLDRRDENVHIQPQAGILAEAFETGEAIVFERVDQDPELSALGSLLRCRAGVCYALGAGLDLYGAIVLATPAPRRPSHDHLELMQAFVSQAGIAFQNAKLYEASRKEQDQIIQSDNEMRQKLARDLHDGPTQKIAGLVMQLEYIKHLLDTNPTEAKAEIDKARAVAQQATKEIRTALFTLRPLALESKGLSAAVEQFGTRLRETENLPIQVVPGEFGTELDANFATTVFAIIEEAVGNARKHANHAPIFVSLQRKDNSLIAVVQDQGPGFDVDLVEQSYDKRASLGLQNMRERARLIDGNLTIVSAPGQGTRVTLAAPIPPPKISGSST
jgi:signal transduction histidine kinase